MRPPAPLSRVLVGILFLGSITAASGTLMAADRVQARNARVQDCQSAEAQLVSLGNAIYLAEVAIDNLNADNEDLEEQLQFPLEQWEIDLIDAQIEANNEDISDYNSGLSADEAEFATVQAWYVANCIP